MFSSKYARYLPEVGEPVLCRARYIERLEHERAQLLLRAEALQREIASEEMDLEREIVKTWKRAEVKRAIKSAEQA